jgi:hypothetical protein
MPWRMAEEEFCVANLHTGHDISRHVMANTVDCMEKFDKPRGPRTIARLTCKVVVQ